MPFCNSTNWLGFAQYKVLYNIPVPGGHIMTNTEVQRKIKTLGILNIEASGDLSDTLVRDAIRSTEELYSTIDFEKLKEEFDEAEKQYLNG